MQINTLIDRDYGSVSILEDLENVAEWLQEREYYAVVDEERQTVGIITARDFVFNPCARLMDCDIAKPQAYPSQSTIEVFNLMKQCRSAYLPVFDGSNFIGVISVWAITSTLLKFVDSIPGITLFG